VRSNIALAPGHGAGCSSRRGPLVRLHHRIRSARLPQGSARGQRPGPSAGASVYSALHTQSISCRPRVDLVTTSGGTEECRWEVREREGQAGRAGQGGPGQGHRRQAGRDEGQGRAGQGRRQGQAPGCPRLREGRDRRPARGQGRGQEGLIRADLAAW